MLEKRFFLIIGIFFSKNRQNNLKYLFKTQFVGVVCGHFLITTLELENKLKMVILALAMNGD